MKFVRNIILFSVFFSTIIVGKGQDIDSTKFKFIIEQNILPGPNPIYSYKVKDKKVIVLKESLVFGINTGIKLRKHTTNLSESDYNAILTILKSMHKMEYKNSYSSYVLDGVSWKVEIHYLNKITHIELHNTKLVELENILNIINKYPKTKGIVRFGILDE